MYSTEIIDSPQDREKIKFLHSRQLINYLPEFLREVKENHAILNTAEQPEIDATWNAIDEAVYDQFVHTATENGVSRLEKILKIVPGADETLDSRKFAILSKMNEELPYTFIALKRMLAALCGEDGYWVDRDVDKKILYVKVSITVKHNFNRVAELLERIVPANMIIDLSLSYTQHLEVKPYRHRDLKHYEHEEIRNKKLGSKEVELLTT